MNDWRQWAREEFEASLADLQRLCRQPSVSAQGLGISDMVDLLSSLLEDAGGQVHVFRDFGNPLVFAEFEPSYPVSDERTLLFYNHYDVQPPEPLNEWSVPPFEAVVRDGRLIARGAADNKGNIMARLSAVRVLMRKRCLPCRVKFVIEGEEEIGSPNLGRYLERYAHLFRADGCIWEGGGGKTVEKRVEIVLGVKGMCYLQMRSRTADVDLHSSFGAVVDNAAWRLVQALATLRTPDHRIQVAGFYDDVLVPTEEEQALVDTASYDEAGVARTFGIKRPFITGERSVKRSLVFEPTLTICGLDSGYSGPGSKTVLPKQAQAKIDIRLVPDQDPNDILRKVRKHLDQHGFSDIEVELLNGQRAYRARTDHPFVGLVVDAAREAYGTEVDVWPNSPGTGPMDVFGHYLGHDMPIVATGCGWWNSRIHAPDESLRLLDFQQGILHMVMILSRLSAMSST
ncbi:M20/M25/M40 family metallo-hydrolase [Alicyclobacillus macrosporangiidus]|uniref:M20/M25/M40 family metallo-hydrolase n=1 Tax=Alicyclobacillus macrosporangiidus TaxID=392015 RepID=UPI0004963592|nr:M20/M25/M40 family metallo-hydrolase [Alicyclobacillus macrosporangiidus]